MIEQYKSAFPIGDHRNVEPEYGINKREYIATSILNGLISAWGSHDVTDYNDLAHDAVMAADALINQLEIIKP